MCLVFSFTPPPPTHFVIQFSCLVFPSYVQLPSLPFFVYIVVFSLVFLSVCFHVLCGFLISVPVLILCGSFLNFMLQTVLLLWGFVFLPCVLSVMSCLLSVSAFWVLIITLCAVCITCRLHRVLAYSSWFIGHLGTLSNSRLFWLGCITTGNSVLLPN